MRTLFDLCIRHSIRFGAWLIVKRVMTVRVEGLEHVPRDEPVLFAARHFHHLYDGALLLVVVPRPVHIIVALDWVRGCLLRLAMEFICRLARWPVVLRDGQPSPPAPLPAAGEGSHVGRPAAGKGSRARSWAVGDQEGVTRAGSRADARVMGDQEGVTRAGSAYDVTERGGYLRRALRDTTRLLREDHTVVIFPEGYPNVDPGYSPKAALGDGAFLPFQAGFIRLAELAQRDRHTRVAIVPTGLSYRRLDDDPRGRAWAVALRFGAPVYITSRADRDHILRTVEEQVRLLSGLAAPPIATTFGSAFDPSRMAKNDD